MNSLSNTESSRRGFFGLLFAAPIAAKNIAAQAATGIGIQDSGRAIIPCKHTKTIGKKIFPINIIESHFQNGIDIVKKKLLPFKKARLDKQASQVSYLSPEIAGLKSVSLSSKVRMQRKLQIIRAEEQVWFDIWARAEHNAVINKYEADDDDNEVSFV